MREFIITFQDLEFEKQQEIVESIVDGLVSDGVGERDVLYDLVWSRLWELSFSLVYEHK